MPINRIPLYWPWNPRSADTTKDPKNVNIMVETVGDKNYVLKRPGTQLLYNVNHGAPGQGITYYNGATYSVTNDQLVLSSSNNSGTSGTTWQSAGVANWTARSSFGCVDVAGTIYVLGGIIDSDSAINIPTADVWSITPGTGWQLCTSGAPWVPRAEPMVVNGGAGGDRALILMGGVDASNVALNDVWASPDGVNWTQLTDNAPWAPRYGATALVYQGTIYLMGGYDGSTVYNDIWVSIDGVTWAQIATNTFWPARAFAAGYVFNYGYSEAIWIVGGCDVTLTGMNDVWYSTDGGKNWTFAVAAFPTGIFAAGYTVYNNKMWLINGRSGATVATALNTVYSSSDGISWTQVTTNGPWQASSSGAVVQFPTATSVSEYNYKTMYWVGGNNAGGIKTNAVYYGTLDLVQSLLGGLTPAIAGQPYQFAAFQEGNILLVKNQCGLWIVSGGVIRQVISNGYPGETVPGLVVLGAYAYVMDKSGLIHNCESDAPAIWPLLNVVGADYEFDPAVALSKYLNYVVAFGTYTTQFFYDAGVADGSPLRPYLNANMKVGCAAAATVVDMGPTIMWLGRTQEYNRQVFMMNGMSPQVVSTPAIDKMLNGASWADPFAFSYYADGHLFYVLSCFGERSFAYDMSTKQWHEWTDYTGGNALIYAGSASNLDLDGFMVQSVADGNIYLVGGQYYTDNGNEFPVELVTDKVDFGNNYRKFWGSTTLICDRNTGTATIRTSDNDYQSYDVGRTVDTSKSRPVLWRNGSSRRRAWKVTIQNDQPMRWEALEVAWEQGAVQAGLAGG